ncbi:MAG: DUF1697 domain-containing protein [Myxococcota bacterium]
MPRFVALLRGINVGKARRIPMKELRALFAEQGLDEVTTYIASGNVLFTAARAPDARLLQEALGERFGFPDVPVVVCAEAAFRRIAGANPFACEGVDPARSHVGFLGGAPAAAAGDALAVLRKADDERLALAAGALYLDAPSGLARTKLTPAALEAALGTTVTLRNLRTVRALLGRLDESAAASA